MRATRIVDLRREHALDRADAHRDEMMQKMERLLVEIDARLGHPPTAPR